MDEPLWRGSSLTERSSERRRQLLEAGLDLLGAGGGRAITVRSVCRDAGLSPKYFYESFTDRDQLIGALYDSAIAQLAAAAADAAGAADRDDVRAVLSAVFVAAAEFFRADRRRVRIVFTEPLVDDALRTRARETFPRLVATLAPEVGIRIDAADPVRGPLALAALGGSLLLTFVTWLEGGTGMDERGLAEFCVDVVLSTPGVLVASE
ncbi:TetR/AcrR family transcriptional regulator [Dietzia sp. SLG310A2-38A2]|uniref:TetR/AcrR family transcriptional regulator n=1 Tax=Dietzia sp. SLG310A2-38A2 TaxID=1630643 RepID=UPI0015F7A7CE|nr:TetR/AcrR family transcriptional regulator [Dietzia sp. SLG310A2-38A2]MBB1030304.1 TetR/AcrR family transcriptional regulator [Dietzia sp. SLG310A2-38A2]